MKRKTSTLSPELRMMVRRSVALLGQVILEEVGAAAYRRIETTRHMMTQLRGASPTKAAARLRERLKMLEQLPRQQRVEFAHSYTLMLELMNACENAYRSRQIGSKLLPLSPGRPDAIIYVLTAHPTEARSPANIAVFHQIRTTLARPRLDEDALKYWLKVAWRTPTVRARKPKVRDEAEQIYCTLLRDETLRPLLAAGRELAPVYVRSWVGGDKDGHPGVGPREFLESLTLSRKQILEFLTRRLQEAHQQDPLPELPRLLQRIRALRTLRAGDAEKVLALRQLLRETLTASRQVFGGTLHPSLQEIEQLIRVFPAFVVPLEFRESSDVLMGTVPTERLAITQMLRALAGVAKGGEPRWYVRGFIISMAASLEHIRKAASLQKLVFGKIRLPIVPLFEEAGALADSPEIIRSMICDRELGSAIRKLWQSRLEIMVGYSDSAKEKGVFPSRLELARAMPALDRLCRKEKVTPIFFQGSGGSIDRGGGTVREQTSWWPPGALRNYKVTIQGEMVERSLASPEITRRQIERIVESAGDWKKRKIADPTVSPELERFSARIAASYERQIQSPDFLRVIGAATPYRFLDELKMGSRPAKRSSTLMVRSLRAIPWTLCWTQTRVLFPVWWGVGSAWEEASKRQRVALHHACRNHPVFAAYIRALGFTLSKTELSVWRLYLERSTLPRTEVDRVWKEMADEHRRALEFAHAMLGPDLLDWRPWLGESITLRAPMIHPLNLLQILALEKKDFELLRITVVGISSGMMNTG